MTSNTELGNTKNRIEALRCQCVEVETDASVNVPDKPLLQRVLNATELIGEVLSLIEKILVFDDEHIEIRFAFGVTNA